MWINKDEARVLSYLLRNPIQETINGLCYSKEEAYRMAVAFENLEKKLDAGGVDNRRLGRTSLNDSYDCLKRFVKNSTKDIEIPDYIKNYHKTT